MPENHIRHPGSRPVFPAVIGAGTDPEFWILHRFFNPNEGKDNTVLPCCSFR